MTVVVDLGCHFYPDHPGDESLHRLINRFHPNTYYGFDPHPDVVENRWHVDGTEVNVKRWAAWTFGGMIGYTDTGIASRVGTSGRPLVRCFDLAVWLRGLARGIVVKVDVESAEYPLLEHLIARDVDDRIGLLLVEWHEPPIGPDDWEPRRARLEADLRCPIEEWQ